MAAPTPYVYLSGTARDALTFYGDVFGCAVQLHTYEEFDRSGGPANAIAHGHLMEGRTCFARLAEGGRVVDALRMRALPGDRLRGRRQHNL